MTASIPLAESNTGYQLTHRLDIQALRGLAIIYVLVQHAQYGWLSGGFLGVDIFFVVSGFLVTGMIVDELDRGTFTLRNFYVRRIRRLLPAAYCTIAVTAAVAPFLLDFFELKNLLWQVLGSFGFVSNYVLWRQVDYFNGEADLKPLLHMWSLSLEEQYYFFLPFVLIFTPRRIRFFGCNFNRCY